jgi:hypothetical protein
VSQPKPILNRHLKLSDLPKKIDEWGDFEETQSVRYFSATFDGYEYMSDKCLDLAKFFSEIYRGRPNALNCLSMSGVRLCLFAEFRNEAHNDYGDGTTNDFVKALLDEIKSRLQ